MTSPTQLPVWSELVHHYQQVREEKMSDLFIKEPDRFARYSCRIDGLLFDYSKHRITQETLELLLRLARQSNFTSLREDMFSGAPINCTENRAVLHAALRGEYPDVYSEGGVDLLPLVNSVLERMQVFTQGVRNGSLLGSTGKAFAHVVNIGIGGSDLGPRLAVEALAPYGRRDLTVDFVSNVDGSEIDALLSRLDPERTLFVVASKTFTTLETMLNANTAREWLVSRLGNESAVAHHFAAVSTSADKVAAFGIASDRTFEFWPWVGGRYSLWSSIGLSIALSVGMERFRELLSGARVADQHFRTAPLRENIPVLMGLLGIWYRNFFGAETHGVLPYDQRLARLPAYLQQADMESNGKSVYRDGELIDGLETGPVVWGAPGTNGQHAFFQLLHQGTSLIPCDFVVAVNPHHSLPEHHAALVANCFAQSEALMRGQEHVEPHRRFSGNRPSSTFLLNTLDPKTLGTLLALYEHKIFVQGAIWDINSFDQWGVELGKEMARAIIPELAPGDAPSTEHDGSTEGLVRAYRELRK